MTALAFTICCSALCVSDSFCFGRTSEYLWYWWEKSGHVCPTQVWTSSSTCYSRVQKPVVISCFQIKTIWHDCADAAETHSFPEQPLREQRGQTARSGMMLTARALPERDMSAKDAVCHGVHQWRGTQRKEHLSQKLLRQSVSAELTACSVLSMSRAHIACLAVMHHFLWPCFIQEDPHRLCVLEFSAPFYPSTVSFLTHCARVHLPLARFLHWDIIYLTHVTLQ